MNLLEARGLTKLYGSLAALRDVSFDVGEGEIVGLIGPNGAGKTTLINVLTGTTHGWTGEIRFRGASLRGLRPYRIGRLGIARTFQVAQPFAQMTVRENLLIGGLFGDSENSARVARRRAEELLMDFNLEEKADQPAETLNAPERKRLEMAKALSTKPELVLLDEVLAGLNPAEIGSAVELIRRVRAGGVTIFLVEHVMQAIASLADRVIMLHHGEKILEGPPASVLADEHVIGAYLGTRSRRGVPGRVDEAQPPEP